jgi:hypothetical protein
MDALVWFVLIMVFLIKGFQIYMENRATAVEVDEEIEDGKY